LGIILNKVRFNCGVWVDIIRSVPERYLARAKETLSSRS